MAARSVSVPMTLSDLEQGNARDHFRGISPLKHVPFYFDLEVPNSALHM